jgi:FixJ family two-component response regulator
MTQLPRLSDDAEALTGGGLVLVVDDDDAVRRSTARLLARAGFETVEVPTAAEALSTIVSHEPPVDVLLSDVVMPQMTGIELAAAVADARPTVEVLLFSGFTPATLVRHDMAAEDAPTILQKPVERTKLVDAVTDAVVRSRRAQRA